MPFLLAATALIVGVLFWVLRMHRVSRDLKELDRDTKGLQLRAACPPASSARRSSGWTTSASPQRS